MGGSTYSRDDYSARVNIRALHSIPTFKHDDDIRTHKVAARVHKTLDPKGVKIRESRDSDAHPVTVPVGVILDTTGSMADVPQIIEKKLNELMGTFLEDKVSGKKYLGDGYPAILIGAIDDYYAQGADGALQVGQFESGMEIDENLENLWLTRKGGGTYEESYDLALYFFARHTAHDHWDKRKRKGYLFLIGDEKLYPEVNHKAVASVIGDSLQSNIPIETIIDEVKERYHVFFLIPNMTQHYGDSGLERFWVDHLGQQNVLHLREPEKVCELIASCVAICEEHVGVDDLITDGVMDPDAKKALVLLSKTAATDKYTTAWLPASSSAPVDRL